MNWCRNSSINSIDQSICHASLGFKPFLLTEEWGEPYHELHPHKISCVYRIPHQTDVRLQIRLFWVSIGPCLNTVPVDFSTFRPCCRRYRRYSQPALRDVSTNCTRENLRCLRIQTKKQHAKRTTTTQEMIKGYSMIRGADMVLRRPCG